MPRMVWVEIDTEGRALRILKNQKFITTAIAPVACVLRSVAVTTIRRKIWDRDKHTCTHCGAIVPWSVFEMHERQWRGRGGEISVSNGTTLCNDCHQNDKVAGHGNRKVRFGESSN